MANPGPRCSKKGSDPCPWGLQPSQEDKTDTHKRAEKENSKDLEFFMLVRVSSHVPRGWPMTLGLEASPEVLYHSPFSPNTASLQKVGMHLPKCYRFQCCGPGETKATEGKCFRGHREKTELAVSNKPGPAPKALTTCQNYQLLAFLLLGCNRKNKFPSFNT